MNKDNNLSMNYEATALEAPALKQESTGKALEPSPMSTGSTREYEDFGTVELADIVDVQENATSEENSVLTPSTEAQVAKFQIMGTHPNHHMRNLSHGQEQARSSPLEAFPAMEELRISSQVTLTTQMSDELLNPKTMMAPTTHRPASASFATQQRVRRIGSFVSSNRSIEKAQYVDRVPVRLVFKHEKLETLAQTNLKSRIVMALYSLTVNEFLQEVLQAMKASRRTRHSHIQIVFYGKSVPFPIHFSGSDYMEKVFKKICTIEQSRELSKNGSNEELHNAKNRTTSTEAVDDALAQRENRPQGSAQLAKSASQLTSQPLAASKMIIAEISMRDHEQLSDGGPLKSQSQLKEHRRKRHHSKSSGRAHKPRSQSNNVESDEPERSSCAIF